MALTSRDLLVAVSSLSLTACLCSPGTASDLDAGQASDLDAGPAQPPAMVSVRLRTLCDPCSVLSSASVFRSDGGLVGGSDVRGQVGEAEVPAWGELRVASAGTVPTWNTLRGLRDGGEVALLAIPREAFIFAFSAAGLEPSPARGHLLISVVDERMLPIAGVQVEVDATRGSTTRYVDGAGFVGSFDAGTRETQPHLGVALVLNVEPGKHGLHLTRAGTSLDDGEVEVHAGEVTFFELVVAGQDGSPARFVGKTTATPALPASGSEGPLRGARTVLHDVATGTEFETSTDDAGVYTFELPFARRWVDVSYPDPPFGPLRWQLVCVQPVTNQWNWGMNDRFYQEQHVLARLRGAPLDASRGVVMASTVTRGATFGDLFGDSSNAIVDATVTLAGGAPSTYSDGKISGTCARGSCGDGGACPSGTRCEGGECLFGPAPMCAQCTIGCPGGGVAWVLPGDSACRCFPSRPDCRAPTPACPTGASCVPMLGFAWDGGLVPAQSLCVPAPADGTKTMALSSGYALPAVFTDVDAGVMELEAAAPGTRFAPARVRVSPGTFVYARVHELPDGG